MSIENRLRDARLLYDAGRYEGALLSVLTAVAGSSRKRYPEPIGAGKAFQGFMREEMARVGNCSVPIGLDSVPMERFLYTWLRNNLAHQGSMHRDVAFEPGPMSSAWVRAELMSGRIFMSPPFILLIGYLVATARENPDIPDEVLWAMSPLTLPISR